MSAYKPAVVKGRPPTAPCGHPHATVEGPVVNIKFLNNGEHVSGNFSLNFVEVAEGNLESVKKSGWLGSLVMDYQEDTGILRLDNEKYPVFWAEVNVKQLKEQYDEQLAKAK